jgi:hypothetical protein
MKSDICTDINCQVAGPKHRPEDRPQLKFIPTVEEGRPLDKASGIDVDLAVTTVEY